MTPTDVPHMSAALAELGDALRAAAQACDDLAAGSRDAWPAPSPPSHERLASVLASLHDAAAGTRLAARRCDRAAGAIAATEASGPAWVEMHSGMHGQGAPRPGPSGA